MVPAVMTHVSVAIEFILDKENRMAALTNLINDDSFLAVVSLAPGMSTVAKTVSRLAQKIIQSFMPAEERHPIDHRCCPLRLFACATLARAGGEVQTAWDLSTHHSTTWSRDSWYHDAIMDSCPMAQRYRRYGAAHKYWRSASLPGQRCVSAPR